MPRNPSHRARQISVIAPPLEVCLLPHEQSDFPPCSPSSSPNASFFLTPGPLFWQHRGQRKRVNGSGLRSNLHRGHTGTPVPVQQLR